MKGITERKKVEWWCGRQIANHTHSCFPTGLTHNPSLHSSKKDWSEMVLKCPCPQMVHVILHTSPVLQNGRWRVCDCELHWLLSSRLRMVWHWRNHTRIGDLATKRTYEATKTWCSWLKSWHKPWDILCQKLAVIYELLSREYMKARNLSETK